VLPVYRRLQAAFERGDHDDVRRLQSYAALMVERLAAHGYMAAAKATMRYLGVDVGSVRAPLPPLADGGEEAVREALEELELQRHLA
jgi:dihydrodipicolinate synthase/N-acetylneuraminate lyase